MRFQIRGDVQRGAAPGSGSKAPAGAASSPARKSRQASKSARRQLGHRAGLAEEREGLLDRALPRAGHADELLADDVERRGDHLQRLEAARAGGPGRDHRAGDLRGRRGREEQPARGRAQAVARPPHPLHAPGHAAGQPDLDGQVGRADVDAQLQAGAGDDRLQPALLEQRSPPRGGGGRRAPSGAPRRRARTRSRRRFRRWRRPRPSAQVVLQVVGDLLGERPRVGEDDVVRLAFMTWRSRRISRR